MKLIREQEEYSEKTGSPCMFDVVGATPGRAAAHSRSRWLAARRAVSRGTCAGLMMPVFVAEEASGMSPITSGQDIWSSNFRPCAITIAGSRAL